MNMIFVKKIYMNCNRFVKLTSFLCKVSFIFTSEFVLFCIRNNYSKFIERLTYRLSSTNILYVKLFQAVSLNNHFINEKTSNEIIKFTDNVPWNISDIRIEELIQFCDTYDIILKDGFEKPINSGMISLVYKGICKKDKSSCIIKMKRNGIDEKLFESIEILKTVVYILSFIPIFRKYEIDEIINKNIYLIKEQINFKQEVENTMKIRNNCKNLKYVQIPEINKSATDEFPNFILMEYIEGIKINQVEEVDFEIFAKQIVKFAFVTTMVHGLTHSDLHSGNILFMKNKIDDTSDKITYKIGVIDFGIVYELDDNFKDPLLQIISHMFDVSPKQSAIQLLNILIEPHGILEKIPKECYNTIVGFTEEIVKEVIYTSKKANQMQIYNFLIKLKDYINSENLSNMGIRPSENFFKLMFVFSMSNGIIFSLCNDELINIVDQVVNELFCTKLLIDD